MHLHGSKELVSDVHERELCIGCGGCVDLCPYLRVHQGKARMLFPCTLEQGRCFAHCPKVEVDFDALSQRWWGTPYGGRPLGAVQTIRASRAGGKALKGAFQGGGTATALMQFALSAEEISGAVVTGRDGLNPIPRIATTAEDISACAGSKFMAAPTLAGLNRGIRKGRKQLGIVGTPCQMLAVAQMRSNPLNADEFVDPVSFSVGLFCNWSTIVRFIRVARCS